MDVARCGVVACSGLGLLLRVCTRQLSVCGHSPTACYLPQVLQSLDLVEFDRVFSAYHKVSVLSAECGTLCDVPCQASLNTHLSTVSAVDCASTTVQR